MNIALLLSGGTGTRTGYRIPKQYIEVEGRPVISYCIERFALHARIDMLWIVADLAWHKSIEKWVEQYGCGKKFKGFSAPGVNRQMSILNGIRDIQRFAKGSDCVLIHDAARPMVSEELISGCLDAVLEHDGAVPVLPVKDTVYCSEDGKRIDSLLERSRIYAGQAPEAFRLEAYYEANMRLLPEKILKINGSTEPAVMAGLDVLMITGDENNFKITTKTDLETFRKAILEKESGKRG